MRPAAASTFSRARWVTRSRKQWGQSVVVENRPGRRRHGCLAGARDVGARRLHADGGGERSRHQSVSVSENPLRHVQGFHGDFDVGVVAQYSAGARGFAVQDASPMSSRQAQGQAGQPFLRPVRQRHLDASGRRTAQEPRQDRHRARFPTRAARRRSTICSAARFRCRSTTRPETLGQLAAGTLRALAVTTATRSPFLPNVPAIVGDRAGLRHRGVVGAARARPACRRIWWRKSRMISSPR